MTPEHYTAYTKKWQWPNFSPRELACKGTGTLLINEDALDKLQTLRKRLGKPLIIRSAYRSPQHNRAVRGATNSLHMQGIAFDVAMTNHDPHEFEQMARDVGFTGFGYYPKSGFMHIDTGPARSWGTPWPKTATGWPVETPRKPETIADDTETQAAVGAGVWGVIAATLEKAPLISGIFGDLAPTAQIVALCIAGAFLAFWFWKRFH
jgi:hypothetical protein